MTAIVRSQAESRAACRPLAAERIRGLVSGAAAGDEQSWDALLAEFGGMVWSVVRAHRLADSDAADVVQATWLRLLENIDRLRDPARVGAWLATTARRESLRVLSHARRSVPYGDEAPEPVAEENTSAQRVVVAERDRALWRSFARLRTRDRTLLGLLIAEPQPAYEEIAAELRMPVGSIGPTRARALDRLRTELTSDGAMSLIAA